MDLKTLAVFILFLQTCTIMVTSGETGKVTKNKLNSEEISAVRKLQSELENRLPEAYMKEAHYLVRFLRASHLNIQDAAEMIISYLDFRKEHRLENITQEIQEIERSIPYAIRHDRVHRPVVILSIGQWKVRQIMVSGKRDAYKRAVYKLLELVMLKMREATKATGKEVNEAIEIVDVTGFNNREHACVICMTVYYDLFSIYEKYYPQIFQRMIFVNSPRLFDSVWTFVKPILSSFTKKSVTFYGFEKQEWKAELLKLVAEDQLPRNLGGTLEKDD